MSLVAVEHEDRQRTVELGADDLRAGEVEAVGVRLLADDDHVVPARLHSRASARV